MLRANDESEPRAWKRFDDNAELQVIYAYKPGVPTNVGIIPGTGTTAYCRTSADPLVVTMEKPTIQARVQTQVPSTSGALLQAEFALERRGTDNVWRQIWVGDAPDSGWDPDNTLERMATPQLADGYMYRLKARTQSHWTYLTVPDDLWSAYSSWCYFKTDSAAPKAPRITSVSPYTLCSTVCEGNGGPGIPGTFVFEPNTADITNGTTDITYYEWKLLSTVAKSVPRGTTLSTTVNTVSPPLAGTQVLSVRAKDVYNRWGAPQEFIFKVAPAEELSAAGIWTVFPVPATTATDTAEAGSTITPLSTEPVPDGPPGLGAARTTFAAAERLHGNAYSDRLRGHVRTCREHSGLLHCLGLGAADRRVRQSGRAVRPRDERQCLRAVLLECLEEVGLQPDRQGRGKPGLHPVGRGPGKPTAERVDARRRRVQDRGRRQPP